MKKHKRITAFLLAILFVFQPLSVLADSGFVPGKTVAGIFQFFGFNDEKEYDDLLAKAQEHFTSGEYAEAFSALKEIGSEYSKYNDVKTLYTECEKAVLEFCVAPDDIEDFDACMALLDECLGYHNPESFKTRRAEIYKEWTVFVDIENRIFDANTNYNAKNYSEALYGLEVGVIDYPDSEKLKNALDDMRTRYVVDVTSEAMAFCDDKEYKEALAVVESAIETYDCEELHYLEETIKELKNPLNQFKDFFTNKVDKLKAFTKGLHFEKVDVKKALNDAGEYILDSGETLLLGEYSDKDITLLTFTGNIVLAMANLDLIFDIRDLIHTATHFDGEYCYVELATGVIALLPVVGVTKYLDNVKQLKHADEAAELLGKFSDKITELSENVVKTVSDSKIAKKLRESKDFVVRKADEVAVALNLKYYELPKSINLNMDYLGEYYPGTNVKFVVRKVDYSDGRKFKGVFPVFESLADVKISEEFYNKSKTAQKAEALKQLQKKTQYWWSSMRKNFTEEQLEEIKAGKIPSGYVWHHNEKEGLMQLVDAETHDKVKHLGGNKLWRTGYGIEVIENATPALAH